MADYVKSSSGEYRKRPSAAASRARLGMGRTDFRDPLGEGIKAGAENLVGQGADSIKFLMEALATPTQQVQNTVGTYEDWSGNLPIPPGPAAEFAFNQATDPLNAMPGLPKAGAAVDAAMSPQVARELVEAMRDVPGASMMPRSMLRMADEYPPGITKHDLPHFALGREESQAYRQAQQAIDTLEDTLPSAPAHLDKPAELQALYDARDKIGHTESLSLFTQLGQGMPPGLASPNAMNKALADIMQRASLNESFGKPLSPAQAEDIARMTYSDLTRDAIRAGKVPELMPTSLEDALALRRDWRGYGFGRSMDTEVDSLMSQLRELLSRSLGSVPPSLAPKQLPGQ